MSKKIAIGFLLLATITPLFAQKPRVAIFGFVSDNYARDTTAVTELFTAELYQSGAFTLVERGEIDRYVEQEHFFQISRDVDLDQLAATGRLMGAEYVISGSVTNLSSLREDNISSEFRDISHITVKMVSVETGEIVFMAEESFENHRTGEAMIARLAARVGAPSVARGLNAVLENFDGTWSMAQNGTEGSDFYTLTIEGRQCTVTLQRDRDGASVSYEGSGTFSAANNMLTLNARLISADGAALPINWRSRYVFIDANTFNTQIEGRSVFVRE